MANLFDKDKQPVEWLLEEIKALNEMAEVSANQGNQEITQLLANIQLNTDPSGSQSSEVQQPIVTMFKTFPAFGAFMDTIQIGKTLNIKKMVLSASGGGFLRITCYSRVGDQTKGWVAFENATYIKSSPTDALVQRAIIPQLVIENVKVQRTYVGGDITSATTNCDGIYLEYTIE